LDARAQTIDVTNINYYHPSNNNTHLFLSLTTGRILHRGYQSNTVVPMPAHVIAHIDALGAAADAEPGVYIDATNRDTDYEPLNDVSTNSPDEPLDPDFLPITAAERDWIRVNRQRRVPGVAAGVAGRFNNDDDSGSTSSDRSDASTASNDTDDHDNDDNANDQDEALQNNPFAVLTDDDDEDDAGSDYDADADSGADSEEQNDRDENGNEDDTTDADSSHEASGNDSPDNDSAPDDDDDDDSTADFAAAEHHDDRSVEDTMPENRSADSEDTNDMPPLLSEQEQLVRCARSKSTEGTPL
jgi:hypothetical protein